MLQHRSALPLRFVYATMAGVAIVSLSLISYRQFANLSPCPAIGAVPACYVLLACYVAVFASAFLSGARQNWFYWPAWSAVFVAAGYGSSLELMGQVTCPRSSGGTPTCYYSLAMAVLILAMYLAVRKLEGDAFRGSN